MLISAHIIIAAGVGSAVTNPFAAFFIGAASHFLGDAIPHWEYRVDALAKLKTARGLAKISVAWQPDVRRILFLISLEIALGFALVLLLLSHAPTPAHVARALAGGIGGLLPDVLWGVAENSTLKILGAYYRFHAFCHSRTRDVQFFAGFLWQLAAVVFAAFLLAA